ncbi:MAG: hypothetical protein GDA52_08870 [Rhodobacteraceae bacterium]|nr:hypothetical protein [Paracoccaceae bacterium]
MLITISHGVEFKSSFAVQAKIAGMDMKPGNLVQECTEGRRRIRRRPWTLAMAVRSRRRLGTLFVRSEPELSIPVFDDTNWILENGTAIRLLGGI